MNIEDQVEKELAKVDEAATRGLRDMKSGIAGWVIAALLAIGAAALVFYLLESHSGGQQAPKAAKPVDVKILPPAPARP